MTDKLAAIHGITTSAFRALSQANRLRIIRGQPIVEEPPKDRTAEKSATVQPKRRHPPPRTGGVGWHFRQMTEQIINQKIGCGCKTMETKLNNLGPAECLARIDELVSEIEANAAKYSWSQLAIAAILGATHAFEWHLSPWSPIRSMLLESIRRAENSSYTP